MAKSVKLLVAAAVVGIGYAAASWYIGSQVETRLRQSVQQYSEESGIPMRITQYQRGLFSSSAITELDLPGGELQLKSDIDQGPLPGFRSFGLARIDTYPILTDAQRAAITELPQGSSPFHLDIHIGFRGSMRLELIGQQWAIAQPNGINFSAQPLSANLNIGSNSQTMDWKLNWGGMSFKSPGNALIQINNLYGQASYTRLSGTSYGYAGAANLHMSDLILLSAPQSPGAAMPEEQNELTMRALTLETSTSLDPEGDWLNIAGRFAATNAVHNGEDVGPLRLSLAMLKLHIPTFDVLYPRLLVLLQQPDPAAAFSHLSNADKNALIEQGVALFSHGLDLVVDDLSFRTPPGMVRLNGSVSAPGLTMADIKFMPLSLLPRLHARLNVDLPLTIAAEYAGFSHVSQWIEEQILEPYGDRVRGSLQLVDGAVTANGKPFNPDSLNLPSIEK